MTIKSDAPISEERREEIYRMCGGRARGVGPEYDDFLANPARIAAYVDAKVTKALEEACKLERWSLRAVDCGDGDDHHYDGLETDPKGEWISLDSIRALLAERVGP